ncbi:hypothetical protein G7066_00595 [Leucobacter coleopterorum]|uniref:Serine hydrolase n=1 Tax=Leucobacter coleopterorum TaxID=2714933 RepID=A0ABX6JTG8_9MICO|nr:hypothetical protein [Leucobacter coleopterorum]QIM17577.1 hypothetical protein G7066_00595 [Leucobacter coleopterorum]
MVEPRERSSAWAAITLSAVLEVADTLGIDLAFVARAVDGSGPVIQHQERLLWPGASLYKVLAAVALYRKEEANLSAPVRVGPESRVAGEPDSRSWRIPSP